MAFDISDIPNKDNLLRQIRQLTGMPSVDSDQTADQQNQAILIEQQRKDQAAAEEADLAKRERLAKIESNVARTALDTAQAESIRRSAERQDWQAGADLGKAMMNHANKQQELVIKADKEVTH